jgi:hypothetical protein
MKILGVVLIILGSLGLAYKSIPYTEKQDVLQIGDFKASAEVKKEIAVPPLVSGAVLGAGVLLLLIPGRRR